METDLRAGDVVIRWESPFFDQNFVSGVSGPVEGDHHQVEVHTQRIH